MIVNPVSGTIKDKTETVEQIRNTFEKLHFQLQVWETTGEDDPEKIHQLIKENKFDSVLIAGGDGTIKMVAEAVLDTGYKVGIIPLGSANGLATSLEISGLDEAVEAVTNGKEIKVDGILINGELCLHLSDFGFNAGLIKKFEEGGERGMLSYFKSSLAQLFDIQPYRFQMVIGDKTELVEAKMLVIANGNKYGTGALINPVGQIDDGLFEIIALNPDGFEDIIKISIALFKGNLNEMESVKIWQTSRAEISNLDKADFQIDGELLGKVEKITVEISGKPIPFYIGKNYPALLL